MKASGQFQKKPIAPSTQTPLTTDLFRSRPFPKPSATTEDEVATKPDFQARLDFARRSAPNLQRLAANSSRDRATMLAVQPKLTVGAPNDQYEQEADRVADQVMSTPDSAIQQPVQREMASEEEEIRTKPIAPSITPLVQREAMPEEEEVQAKAIDPTLQREEAPEEEDIQTKPLGSIQREEMPEEEEVQAKAIDPTLQREEMPEEEVQTKPALQRSTDGSLEAGSSIESRLNSSKGGGSPLSNEVRSFMEPRFGADFSQVRVHTGSESVQMNRDLNAQAFAHKQDVYFGAGKAPANDALTAHELTHTIQQTGALQCQSDIQKDNVPKATSAIPDTKAANPELEAILDNIQAEYSGTQGFHNRQQEAVNTFYTDINKSNSPTPTEQALTVAASAAIGSTIAYLGVRITASLVKRIADPKESPEISKFVTAQIADVCKDEGKLATQKALQDRSGKEGSGKDADFRFKAALLEGIWQSSRAATATFNSSKERYRRSPNGLSEAQSLYDSLKQQGTNAYNLQYAQAAAQWSTLQKNVLGLAGDRGTLVLEIRCPAAGSDVQIVGSRLEGLNEATRKNLSGLQNVLIGELQLPVRIEGENPNWIIGAERSSDNISITGKPGQTPIFEHSGITAYFLIERGIAKYGFQPEVRRNIPNPLQETSAVLMFTEIFNRPLPQLGKLEG
jgi:hypothetical protein